MCRRYGGKPSDRLRSRNFPGWRLLCEDFDRAVASFASWVERMQAITETVGSGKNKKTRQKHSLEHILGIDPADMPAKEIDLGGAGRFGEIIELT